MPTQAWDMAPIVIGPHPPHPHGPGGAENGVQGEPARPEPRLGRKRHRRLDEERIAQQGRQRAEIGNGVEAIGRSARTTSAEPDLRQRTGGGECEIGEADRDRQQGEDLQRGQRRTGRLPNRRRRDRQQRRRGRDQCKVDRRLPPRRRPTRQPMGEGVSAEEHRLEEQHAGRPDGRAAAEPRQDGLADHRLHLEQKQRTQQGDRRQVPSRPGRRPRRGVFVSGCVDAQSFSSHVGARTQL